MSNIWNKVKPIELYKISSIIIGSIACAIYMRRRPLQSARQADCLYTFLTWADPTPTSERPAYRTFLTSLRPIISATRPPSGGRRIQCQNVASLMPRCLEYAFSDRKLFVLSNFLILAVFDIIFWLYLYNFYGKNCELCWKSIGNFIWSSRLALFGIELVIVRKFDDASKRTMGRRSHQWDSKSCVIGVCL